MEDLPIGVALQTESLTIQRAKGLARQLASASNSYARLIACYRHASDADVEIVAFEVDVEVPQHPVYQINNRETLAALFARHDRLAPEVLASRRDFPLVPHLLLRRDEYPRSLCLYDEPWQSLKLAWTPPAFIERVRSWLALTARGELHGSDQPLEPIIGDWEYYIVLPKDAFASSTDGPERLLVHEVEGGPKPGVLIARHLDDPRAARTGAPIVATTFRCEPQEHGVIHRCPTDFAELCDLTAAARLNLSMALQDRLRSWHKHKDIHLARLVITIWFPKTRNSGELPESSDIWAFAFRDNLRDIGIALGLWATHGNEHVPLLSGAGPSDLGKLSITVLNPMLALNRKFAAILNGGAIHETHAIAAIGAGALGSQTIFKLIRAGFGEWVIIDDDRLFPHNLARHELDGFDIGLPKAVALAAKANATIEGPPVVTPLVMDVLNPGEDEAVLGDKLRDSSVILDFSASVPVARALARDQQSEARRLSVFLNPTGTDLIVIAEDRERAISLDALEHQYYRAVIRRPDLSDHLRTEEGRTRYAQSCRDITSTVSEEFVGLHSAIAARAIRKAVSDPASSITVWRADNELMVRKITVDVSQAVQFKTGEWNVCFDEVLASRLAELRQSKLPNETGGILLGSFDLHRKIAYISDTVPSPPDSKEWPVLYIRGCVGLKREVERISRISRGMLQYVGEWHSHPDGCSCAPSDDDCKVFAWLKSHMSADGLPSLMIIAGENNETAVYLGQMRAGIMP